MTMPRKCWKPSGWMWCRSLAAATASQSGRGSAWNAGCRSWPRSRWRWTCPLWKGSSTPREDESCSGSDAHDAGRARAGGGAAGGARRRDRRAAPELQPEDLQVGQDPLRRLSQPKTFPGIAPWVGIHAFDWLHAILGDVFTSVQGREGATARPDYPACASQAAFVLTMKNGGVAVGHARLSAPGIRAHPRRRAAADRRDPRRHRDRAGRAGR